MKKITIIFILCSVYAFGQCLGSPISTRVGVKLGFNPGSYDPGDGTDEFSGMGMHFGIGMGTDIFSIVALDMTPQYRSTSYSRDEALGRRTYSFGNIYFPITLGIKAGMIPFISPYVAFGIGFNIQITGTERFEFSGGNAVETDRATETRGFLIIGGGLEVKLLKFRITPEFTAHISNDEDSDRGYRDYHVSLGAYIAP